MLSSVCLSDDVSLTILHTNDTYGRLLPLMEGNVEMGGVLRRAYLIRQIKAENPQRVILMDSGDAIGPYPLAAFDSGETVIRLMNEMGYHAMTLGNHEFNYGAEVLLERVSQARFPMLSANTYLRGETKPFTQGYVTLEVQGVKVGIIGLTTPSARYRASPELQKSITIGDPIAAAKDTVKSLKVEGCGLIIALSHLGYQSDMELIAQVKEINLVVGSEVELPAEKTISVMSPVDSATGTTLVYSPWLGGYLGRVDICLEKRSDDGYTIKSVEARKYRLDVETYPNETVSQAVPELKDMLENLIRKYQDANQGIIGEARVDEEINSLELIPHIVRRLTKAEIVLLNRGSLKPTVFRGDIQRLEVTESIRYSNQIVMLELTGAQLKGALAHSSKQASESRKLILLGLDASGTAVNGRIIDPNEYYSVATNDFLASGGDGYDMIDQGRSKKYTGLMLREVVIDYIQNVRSSGQRLSLEPLRASAPKFVVKSKVGLDLMLRALKVSQTAKDYPQIKSLQSKNVGDFFHWSIQSDLSTLLASPKYNLELGLISKYGRLQHPRLPSIELEDNISAAARFRFVRGERKFNPVARLEIENIEFTPTEESYIVSQLSAGAEKKVLSGLAVSAGILLRRHQPEEVIENQVDFDFRAQYQITAKGVQIKSELKLFPIVINTGSHGSPFQDYVATFLSSIKFPLSRYLFLSSSIFLYRETRIGPWAHNMDLAIQIHQSWGKKP